MGQGQLSVTPGSTPREVDRNAVRLEQKLGDTVPLDAQFLDRNGKPVQFGDLLEKRPAIVLPIFYNCTGVCNLELRGTLETLRKLKPLRLNRDFNVIVVGIHPKETPDLALKKFKATAADLEQPGTEEGWKFLTGDSPNIHKVTDAIGFHYTYDEKRDAIDHPSGIIFITPTGRVSSYIYGALYTPEAFEKNIKLAAKDQTGAKVQELFFGCIHVDPVTGERSVVIQNVVKLMGIVTLIIMSVSFLVLSGRAQLRRRQQDR